MNRIKSLNRFKTKKDASHTLTNIKQSLNLSENNSIFACFGNEDFLNKKKTKRKLFWKNLNKKNIRKLLSAQEKETKNLKNKT